MSVTHSSFLFQPLALRFSRNLAVLSASFNAIVYLLPFYGVAELPKFSALLVAVSFLVAVSKFWATVWPAAVPVAFALAPVTVCERHIVVCAHQWVTRTGHPSDVSFTVRCHDLVPLREAP